MLIKGVKISDHLSFKDTGWVNFKPGVNLIVGPNNVGKTSFLKAMANPNDTTPHISPTSPTSGNDLDKIVSVDLVIDNITLGTVYGGEPTFFEGPLTVRLDFARSGFTHEVEFFDKNGALLISNTPHHNFDMSSVMAQYFERVFFFNARRSGELAAGITASNLASDGSNLSAYLLHLHTDNPDALAQICDFAQTIIPSIGRLNVGVSTIRTQTDGPAGPRAVVKSWPYGNRSAPRFSFALDQLGTGVTQILGILAAASRPSSSVVMIDEINSFLHPAAARSLMRILNTHYAQHQYIIATHSPEILSSGKPSTVHLIKRVEYESEVHPISLQQLDDLKKVAKDLGITTADAYAADHVIWVEGPTEEICFNEIFEETRREYYMTFGDLIGPPYFIAVIATDEVHQRNKTRKELVVEVYERLTTASADLLRTSTFSFDSELMSNDEKTDITRRRGSKTMFLPRRHFECYLIDPDAIVVLLAHLDPDHPVTSTTVRTEFEAQAGSKFRIAEWNGSIDDQNWAAKVDAANLIKTVVGSVSEQRVSDFKKRENSPALMRWIFANRPEHLSELVSYVHDLVKASQTIRNEEPETAA